MRRPLLGLLPDVSMEQLSLFLKHKMAGAGLETQPNLKAVPAEETLSRIAYDREKRAYYTGVEKR